MPRIRPVPSILLRIVFQYGRTAHSGVQTVYRTDPITNTGCHPTSRPEGGSGNIDLPGSRYGLGLYGGQTYCKSGTTRSGRR